MRLWWPLSLILCSHAVAGTAMETADTVTEAAGTVTETVPHTAAYCKRLPTDHLLRATALSFPDSACGEYLVRCPGIDDAHYYTLYIGPEAGAGTVLSLAGERGHIFHVENLQEYTEAGFRAVAVALKPDGPRDAVLCARNNCPRFDDVNEAGPKEASCRAASILRFLHAEEPRPTCAQGHSAGSSELAYALAHQNVARIVTYVQLTAWTPFARPDYGCAKNQGKWRSYSGVNPDGALQTVRARDYAYRDAAGAATTLTEDIYGLRPGVCLSTPTTREMQRLAAQAIVAPNALFEYPDTVIDAYACLSDRSIVDGNGSWWWEKVRDANPGRAFMQGVDPGSPPNEDCVGEEVWWKKNGEPSPIRQLTIDRMVDLCR